MNVYGNKLYHGEDGITNKESAVNLWMKASELGNFDAAYSLAMLKMYGKDGITRNGKEAYKVFKKLAIKGHPYSQMALAGIYKYNNEIVKQDLVLSFQLYYFAAQNGIVQAYRAVGDAYLNGEGVEKDFKQASEFYMKASEAGDPSGAYNLSLLYYDGRGVPCDFLSSLKYAKEASEKGILIATYHIGVLYREGGGGLVQNEEEAFKYFLIAADKGLEMAAYNVAVMYKEGKGTQKSLSLARTYFQIAAEHPDFKDDATLQISNM